MVAGRAGVVGWLEYCQARDVSILVECWPGHECRKVCNTLRRGRPLSECRAALRTHEQDRGVVKSNVGKRVAVLASYLTLRSVLKMSFIGSNLASAFGRIDKRLELPSSSRPPPKKSIPLLEMLHIYRRETETSSYQNHSAVNLSQFFENKSNVMHAQHPRYGVTPGPLSYQIKRIGVS